MYLLGSFSRTTSIPATTKTALAVMTLVCPTLSPRQNLHQTPRPCRPTRQYHHTSNARSKRPVSSPALESAEAIFLHAIARASLCKKHARLHTTHSRPHTRVASLPETASPLSAPSSRSARFSADHGKKEPAQGVAVQIPKDELRDLVQLYDFEEEQVGQDQKVQKDRPPIATPSPINQHQALATTRQPSRKPLSPVSEYHKGLIYQLRNLLNDRNTPHSTLFETYQALPHPRASYLSDAIIRQLMHILSVVEFKDEQSMLRFLSVVDDLHAANVPMILSEWNSAIAFAGGWVRRVTDLQVETATQIWLRMEREAGVKSDNVTFNILFNVAVKAGKFALAEVIMKEMLARDMKENRYFRTSKIYYYGMKRDGIAVRRSYKELVDAGEFVDTTVLNCVIASLIRAGEASAGEQIFERMKRMHAEKTGTKLPTGGWRGTRELGKVLDRAARLLRKQPEQRAPVQDASPIAPSLHTYRLLIKYHAHESGNIDRVTELLDEMHEIRMNIHGSIFFQLFRGFHFHGGVRYSSWTKSRLDKLCAVFLEFVKRTEEANKDRIGPLDEEERGCYYDSGVVIVVLQAYNKCAGKDTTLEVWDSILERWKPEAEALEAVNGALATMFAFTME